MASKTTSDEIPPKDEVKLRQKFDIEYEFLARRNLLDTEGGISHRDLHDAIEYLSHSEKRTLDVRLKKTFREIEELFENEQRTFDEPHVEHEDLVTGVRLQREDARYR